MDSGMQLDIFNLVLKFNVRWDGAFGIATRFCLDDTVIESR